MHRFFPHGIDTAVTHEDFPVRLGTHLIPTEDGDYRFGLRMFDYTKEFGTPGHEMNVSFASVAEAEAAGFTIHTGVSVYSAEGRALSV